MNRTDELTGKLLDGTLTEAEWGELEGLLDTDPAAAADHLAFLELEAALRGLRTGFDLSEPTLAKVKEAQTEQTTRAVMAEIATQPAPHWAAKPRTAESTRGSRRLLLGVGGIAGFVALAAGLLVGLWLGAGTDSEHPPADDPTSPGRNFARVTQSVGAVELLSPQGEILAATEGQKVPPGHTLRTIGGESLARVELPDQTTVDIESDSVVRFDTMSGDAAHKPRLFLAAGQLTAAVSDRGSARPLVVGTGVADVFGKTGVFVVSSAGPESARVDIKEGNVEVVRRDVPKPMPMDGGSAFFQTGFAKVLLEPTLRADRDPARKLTFPGSREAVFSPDGTEVWVASARLLTRWTKDGGTADVVLSPRKADGHVVFAPDRSAFGTHSGGKDDRFTLRNLPAGDPLATVALKLPDVRFRTLAPAAEWFAVVEPGTPRKWVRVYDGKNGTERFGREFEEAVGCVAAASDGKTLAVGLSDLSRGGHNKIALLDPSTGDRLGTLPTQKKSGMAMTFTAQSDLLAAGFAGMVQVWDVRSRELVRSITGFERTVMCLAFSPDGKRLAGGTQDGQVWVWSVESGRPTQLIEVGSRGIRSVAFSPDGQRLVTVANNAPVAIWDVACCGEATVP